MIIKPFNQNIKLLEQKGKPEGSAGKAFDVFGIPLRVMNRPFDVKGKPLQAMNRRFN
ncbi:MAG: hypothetical protein JWO32_1423 [Bacteroidetes bacterium]|nr:hypothetical protein [Bacteroidota bacterium]